jgi:hypothetical protein
MKFLAPLAKLNRTHLIPSIPFFFRSHATFDHGMVPILQLFIATVGDDDGDDLKQINE